MSSPSNDTPSLQSDVIYDAKTPDAPKRYRLIPFVPLIIAMIVAILYHFNEVTDATFNALAILCFVGYFVGIIVADHLRAKWFAVWRTYTAKPDKVIISLQPLQYGALRAGDFTITPAFVTLVMSNGHRLNGVSDELISLPWLTYDARYIDSELRQKNVRRTA